MDGGIADRRHGAPLLSSSHSGSRDISLTLFSELVDGDGAAGHSHFFSLDGGHMCSR